MAFDSSNRIYWSFWYCFWLQIVLAWFLRYFFGQNWKILKNFFSNNIFWGFNTNLGNIPFLPCVKDAFCILSSDNDPGYNPSMPSIYSYKMNDWNNQTTITSSCDLWLNGSTFCHRTMTRAIFYRPRWWFAARWLHYPINQYWMTCLFFAADDTEYQNILCLDTLPPQTVVRLIPKQTSTSTSGPRQRIIQILEEISTTPPKTDWSLSKLSLFLGPNGWLTESAKGLLLWEKVSLSGSPRHK